MCVTNIILFLLIPLPIFGHYDAVMKMSVDYFVHRNVKFVCLLYCEDNNWNKNFSKNAFASSIAVSQLILTNRSIKTDLGKCLRSKFMSVGILINAKCVNVEDLLQFASQSMFFDDLHKWFIIENNYDGVTAKNVSDNFENLNFITMDNETFHVQNEEDFIETARVLDKFNISVDADITVAKEKGFYYDLYEVFNFGKVQCGSVVVNKMGTWNSEKGLLANFNNYKYYRRWNFQQLTMRLVAVSSTPYKEVYPEMLIGYHPAPGIAEITRSTTMVVNEVAEMHNFRFNYTITDRWLSDFSLNSSKVAASSLYFRTQDLSPILRLIPETNDKIDFAHPSLNYYESRYFYRIPTHGVGKFENQFLTPLSTEVWGYVTVLMLFCVAALLLSAKFEQRPSLVQYAVFSVAALFCQQFFEDNDDRKIRKSLFGRKLSILVTGVSCLLIYNYYTSSVVSWLLNGPPASINSLEELLESPLELIYEDIGYCRSWIQTPTYYFNTRNAVVEDKIRKKKVYNKKKNDPLLVSIEDGFKKMQAGGYAFHVAVHSANQLISRSFTQNELCELGSVASFEKMKVYMTLQKHSPFKEFFVWSLARLSERGIISCIQRRTDSPSVKCEGSSPRALALGGAAPAFMLLAGGYVLATFILFLERLYKKMEDAKVKSEKVLSPRRLYIN